LSVENDMIRILHIVPALDGGGIENLLLNYYTHMDRSRFTFDFIVHGKNIGVLEPIFEGMGSMVFHIPTKREGIVKNLLAMKHIIDGGNYDIVHAHQGAIGAFPMFFAKRAGVKGRITHSHMAYMHESRLRGLVNRVLLPYLKMYSTDWFACSSDAGSSLWGAEAVQSGKVHTMNNAIDVDKFTFSSEVRNNVRKELHMEGKFVIGCVGRLSFEKNHEFLISIFCDIHEKDRDARLCLVGRGELENDIREQVQKLGLNDAILFLGVRNDVPQLLQAMDVFVLPSRYEGLGIAYIEAQAAGLVCFGSDLVVPREAAVTDLMHYISLEESPEHWASEVMKLKTGSARRNTKDEISSKGYEIRVEAKKLEQYYERCAL